MDKYQVYRDYVINNNVTVGDVQKKLLEIFKYFREICEANNLNYWCGGGTMLGAIRHKGFIPWDNDLDVFMPRPDYEKLYEIWNNVADTSHYVLVRSDDKHNYHHTDMSIVDVTTTMVNEHAVNEDIAHGLYIDIIPFEGCPDSKLLRWKQIYDSIIYSVFNAQRLPNNQGKILRLPVKMLLGLIKSPKLRYKIWRKKEKSMSKYNFYGSKIVKETVTSFRALFYEYDREVFDTIDADFEDTQIKIPKGYDEYMKKIYGDYMSVPENAIENMHRRYSVIKYLNLSEPYEKFRGIEYLIRK